MPRIGERRQPTTGWSCREVLDASVTAGGSSRCGFCGTRIRWIHVLFHEDCDWDVEAGCCCATRYCFDYDAVGAEKEAKNRAARLMRFVDPRGWRPSHTNPANLVRVVRLSKRRKIKVTVYLSYGRYGIYLNGAKESGAYWGKFGSQHEAMVMAFELIEREKGGVGS